MNAVLRLVLFTLLSLELLAQELPAFKTLRYEVNHRFLYADSGQAWYEKLKYRLLLESGQTYVSLGCEVRYQYFRFRNEDWGELSEDRYGYVLAHYLAHADLRT
jgi:hypothetical protein